ncbi:hypothetical protein Q0P02_14330, partial [Staphylococcus aureus]|nr:hypothetical protein [Staphylococcus aureus]
SYSYSKEPQKSRQQEDQVRYMKPKKDIQRSPQTVSTYTNSQNQSDRTMNRNEQKKIQTSADNNIEKRQVQGANNHQHYRQSSNQSKPI